MFGNAHLACDFARTTHGNYMYLCRNMEKQGKILIVDDNEDVLFALNLLLSPHVEKVKVITQPSRIEHFMKTFNPDVILLDMNFQQDAISGKEGFDCLDEILKIDNQAVVIFMTAYVDTDKVVKAIKAGATDFISKPWEKEKILATISTAVKLRKSRFEIDQLKSQVTALNASEDIPLMIGESKVMKEMVSMIHQVADSDANIMVLGENGTGKDLVARLLRFYSPRRDKPFITIDLGSIPESLFEGELFGFEKGAFTDAHQSKAGRMEVAMGGTLFLDEIGNLSLPMQSKLLTAIEKKQISRLGSTKITPIDIRLICATNSPIHTMAEEGQFRQDLLYRINTIEIHIPPLRERGEDIILLAEHFIKIFARKYKKDTKGISREAKHKLMQYSWPGNVRELQHVIERAVILSHDPLLKSDDFTLTCRPEKQQDESNIFNLHDLEHDAIERAMKRCCGNMTQAAELLGISRYALYRKLEK